MHRWTKFGGAFVSGALAAASAGLGGPAEARESKVARVGQIQAPFGLQGKRGAGGNVGIIFNLIDPARRKSDVEVQYGLDLNADGAITDDEYRTSTEDRRDSRDTRRNRAPELFTTAGDIGAFHQYVWNSTADIQSGRALTLEYALTPQGRRIPDPDHPGSFLFATGPGGTPVLAGVRIRVRAVQEAKGAGGRKLTGEWVYSDAFDINNNEPPSLAIEEVESGEAGVPAVADEVVKIRWRAFDPDSEDLNGNGQLDVADGEDADGDGRLDAEPVGVAFDYHRLAANEDPSAMSPEQLAALSWLPCTREPGVGETDSLATQPGEASPETGELAGVHSAPPGVGREWTFAWDSMEDVGTVNGRFILRARPFDQKRERGVFSYLTDPITIDNWRVFNAGSAGPEFPVAPLASTRVGHTVTYVRPALNTSDPLDRGDPNGIDGFQSLLVAGGASSEASGAETELDVLLLNTLTSETTTSARLAIGLGTARAFHTATALDDGRILLVGGFDASGTTPLSSTEVYDPKTRTTVPGPVLATSRARHAAVKLAGGDVVVFGGIGADGASIASCERVGVQPYADGGGVPVLPQSWAVTPLPALAVARHSLHAELLPDQTVLVAGGIGDDGAGVRAAQILDPLHDDDTATPKTKDPVLVAAPDMLESRAFGTATALVDGNVLFAGGAGRDSMEVFNWRTREFESVGAKLEFARAQHFAVRLGDGTVLIGGGVADPSNASSQVLADADLVALGARDAEGVWDAELRPLNGDMSVPRRLAAVSATTNGRVMVVAGAGQDAGLSSCETFTPAGGSNRAPVARTSIPSGELSYLFGAPVHYRLSDAEQDRARVDVQFIDRSPGGDRVWHACSAAAGTIGGDVADDTAGLATTFTDDASLAVDPVVRNTPGDHAFIWSLLRDIDRPAPGATQKGFNIRVIPYGAVVGTPSESAPIDVLYNTKILPTILAFENYADGRPDVTLPAGAPTPNQAGDIAIWVHLRDLDGGPGHTGDAASLRFRYYVDRNGDGNIKDTDGELPQDMTPAKARVGFATSSNPQTGLTTWYDAAEDSDPAFGAGHRPAGKGWTKFEWDSVRDLGAPASEFTNVFIEVVPSDANQGFVRGVRNTATQTNLRIIRHPDSLHLLSWRPRHSDSRTAMPVNDPIDFTFNGQIEPSSLSATSLQVWRGKGLAVSQVRGALKLVNDPATNTALVTFFPEAQSLNQGVPAIAQNAASTVLFPNDDYSIRMPGYVNAPDPLGDPRDEPVATNSATTPVTMLRPLGRTFAGGEFSTYRLVLAPPVNAGALLSDPAYTFRTAAAGVYADDMQPVTNTNQSQPSGSGIVRQPTGVASLVYTFDRALDPSTVVSPNITSTIAAPDGTTSGGGRVTVSVVPGKWTLVNAPVAGDPGRFTATLTFVPLIQLPPTTQLQIQWNAGLKGTNGRSPAPATLLYNVETYARVPHTNEVLEGFADQSQNDTTVTTAVWGTDPCAGQALSGGGSGGLVAPTPLGTNGILDIGFNVAQTINVARRDYTSIRVRKGATLVLDSQQGPVVLTSTGDVTIDGTITFAGQDGRHGVHGNATYPFIYGGATSPGTRLGGLGRNGGGSGGNSVSTLNTTYRDAGSAGANGAFSLTSFAAGTGGGGGLMPTETGSAVASRYLYGAGGGAGGGNATPGLAGGRPTSPAAFNAGTGYGAQSVPGVAGGDSFFSTGVPGGGGGGGGASVQFSVVRMYMSGGAGGAGAGSLTIVCNGTFTLSPTGLVDGRGGAGGESAHGSGSGGGGAGGSCLVVANGGAKIDGVIDLRGGIGGAKGFAQQDLYCGTNLAAAGSVRFGGDGAPGRLVVLAPNFANADEVRVYGQLMQRQIAAVPTTSTPLNNFARPTGLSGSVVTQRVNLGTTQEIHWQSLTLAAGAVVDLNSTNTNITTPQQSTPLRIFVDGQVTLNGTLRLNGDSNSLELNGVQFVTGQNFGSRTISTGSSYSLGVGWTTSVSTLTYGRGMSGNLGGGNGGDAYTLGTSAGGREASDGQGPPPLAGTTLSPRGMHNALATSGAQVYSSWYSYPGDSGGTGGANATDGEDGWAQYAVPVQYNYLGAAADTSGQGVGSRSGKSVSLAPKRLGGVTNAAGTPLGNDPNLIDITNVGSFAGSGGGGGNTAGDTYGPGWALAGLGGGGGGALGIVTPGDITIGSGAVIEARGGAGTRPGQANLYANYHYSHAGGGGGSGGTVYLAANTVNVAAVNSQTGAGGATFNLKGGLGGGRRSSQPSSSGIAQYPEYMTTGNFGGSGGYGRLVIDYVTSVNGGTPIANRWGLEQTTVTSTTNLFDAMAGTARFFCPGIVAGGTRARSKWYDLKSVSPIVTAFAPASTVNANPVTTQIEGAQSHPHNAGTAGTGEPDPSNTSMLGVPATNPLLKGWRWFRFETSFTKTSSATGGPVRIDDMTITYTSDL